MGEHGLNNKITYKVYSDVIGVRQNTTTVNLKRAYELNWNTWIYATKVLRNRFRDYRVKINHVGKTVKVEYKEDDD